MRVEIAEIKPRQKYSLAKIAKLNTGKVYGNAISAWGIEQRGSHFGSLSSLCSTKVAGDHFITPRENPPTLYDIHAFSPGFSGDLFIENLCTAKPPFHSGGHKGPFIFYERGGAGGIWGGGTLEKNWLERGGQPKKNEGKGGGSDEKIRLKIG